MRKRYPYVLTACLLISAMLLSTACTLGGEMETETDSGASTVTTTETDGESVGETAPTTEDGTEVNTEPPIEVVIPEGIVPSLASLLHGDSVHISETYDMKNTSPSTLKGDSHFVFTGGTLFAEGAAGLTTQSTGWDTIGLAQPVSTDTYTAEAAFYTYENDRGGAFNAAMVGLYCKTAENLFIDGGIWFSFRENTVTVYVKEGFEVVVDNALPFSAADGIHFKAVGYGEGMTVYANDTHIATIAVTDEGITVADAAGEQIAATDLTHLNVTNGYFRYMSHYANAALTSLSLTGETVRAYEAGDEVYAFLADTPYAFADKAQFLATLPTTTYSELCYVDAMMLGEMLGFACVQDGNTLTMTRDEAILTFEAGMAEVKVNGATHPFPTTVKRGKGFMLAVSPFGEMLGYATQISEGLTTLAKQDHLTEEAVQMAQERFDLYRDVVYNYENVECDQTGVGLYDPAPYEDRLVGIAYTTWHRSATKWGGTATWDLPLYGTYCSDDEAVIRRHGEMLRDAGVDFVFVDWSNNTEYDPATMREYRADFRMIEEATDKLFDVWATIEGAPKICIFVGPGHNGPQTIDSGAHQKKVDQVWNDYVTNPDRADMYFQYDGKPLLICYGATPTMYTPRPASKWDDERYTVRWITGYVGQQAGLFRANTLQSLSYWSWEERGAQTYTVYNDTVEAVTVSAATRSQGAESTTGYIPEAGRENGATFKKQFQRAYDLGARIVLIVSWNEWTTGEQPSAEVSKDMEPSVIHGTFYYDLMREQIKKFKGQVSP